MSTPSLTRGDARTRAGATAESSLGRLPLGARAIITAVGTAQQEAGTAQGRLARRLQDLGLIPGWCRGSGQWLDCTHPQSPAPLPGSCGLPQTEEFPPPPGHAGIYQ